MCPINLSARSWLIVVTAVGLSACAAGFVVAWSWQSNKVDAATSAGEADLQKLRADYAIDLAESQAAAKRLLDAEVETAKEVDRATQETIARITRERDARPRTVRVQCPTANPVPATGARAPGDPGHPDGTATDPAGMAGDGATGYRDLDLSGYNRLTTEAMLVSERLRSLQERCGG